MVAEGGSERAAVVRDVRLNLHPVRLAVDHVHAPGDDVLLHTLLQTEVLRAANTRG